MSNIKPVAKIEIAGVPELIDALTQDGALSLLIGKPAAKALSDLISAGVGLPTAWLDGLSQGRRNITEARSLISASTAAQLANTLAVDEEHLNRSAIAFLGHGISRQINLEAVVHGAASDLISDPPGDEAADLRPDFKSRFSTLASDATSDEMRALFSSVLAGEIRQPGAFSLATLHLLSIMDGKIAKAVESTSTLLVDRNWIPKHSPFDEGPLFDHIGLLMEHSILLAEIDTLIINGRNGHIHTVGEIEVRFILTHSQPSTWVSSWRLSSVGKELMSLLDIQRNPDAETDILLSLFSNELDIQRIDVRTPTPYEATGKRQAGAWKVFKTRIVGSAEDVDFDYL